jgi:hypothetical protein
MTYEKRMRSGCDAVDVATLWPVIAQTAGLPLPYIESAAERRLRKE